MPRFIRRYKDGRKPQEKQKEKQKEKRINGWWEVSDLYNLATCIEAPQSLAEKTLRGQLHEVFLRFPSTVIGVNSQKRQFSLALVAGVCVPSIKAVPYADCYTFHHDDLTVNNSVRQFFSHRNFCHTKRRSRWYWRPNYDPYVLKTPTAFTDG